MMYLRTVKGHLADFDAFGKMLITSESNAVESSALRRSKENNLLHRMARLDVKTERKKQKMHGRKIFQNFDRFGSLVKFMLME